MPHLSGEDMTQVTQMLELDDRIAGVRENIRMLVEQAAAFSGAADEERTAGRIEDQEKLLAELLEEKERASTVKQVN
jgi:hypothetical protein